MLACHGKSYSPLRRYLLVPARPNGQSATQSPLLSALPAKPGESSARARSTLSAIPEILAKVSDSDSEYSDSDISAVVGDATVVNTIRRKAYLALKQKGFYAFSMKEHLKKFETEQRERSLAIKASSAPTANTEGSNPSSTSTLPPATRNHSAGSRLTRSRRGSDNARASPTPRKTPMTAKHRTHDRQQEKQNILNRHHWAMRDFKDAMNMLDTNAEHKTLAKGLSHGGAEEYKGTVHKTAQKMAGIEQLWETLVNERPRGLGQLGKQEGQSNVPWRWWKGGVWTWPDATWTHHVCM